MTRLRLERAALAGAGLADAVAREMLAQSVALVPTVQAYGATFLLAAILLAAGVLFAFLLGKTQRA